MARERNYKVELLSVCMQMGWYGGRGVTPLLIGPPGTGKTQVVEQIATAFRKELQKKYPDKDIPMPCGVLCLPQTMPEELSGVNVPNEDRTSVNRLPLGLLKKLDLRETHPEGFRFAVLAMDEFSSANMATRAAAMTGVSDNRFGDIIFSHQLSKVGMCNPIDQAVNGVPWAPPESSRFVHIYWSIPMGDSMDYMRGGPGLLAHVRMIPETWEKDFGGHTKGLIASFWSANRNLALVNQLAALEADSTEAKRVKEDGSKDRPFTVEQACEGPWACERSWETLGRLLAAIMSLGESVKSALAREAIISTIGAGVGNVFMDWLSVLNIPDPEELLDLSKPLEARLKMLPARPDHLKVALEAMANAAQKKDHPQWVKRWETAWEILGPSLTNNQDMALEAANMITREKPPGANLPPSVTMAARQLFQVRRAMGLSQ